MKQPGSVLVFFALLVLVCSGALVLWVSPEETLPVTLDESPQQLQEILRVYRDETALKEFLRPIPPKEPEEALKTFETLGGFRMELVAQEPMVRDPIAAAFDEDGRLYVAEMIDYPYQPSMDLKAKGQIRLLEDIDGDGRFDRSHIFADQLLWPSGIVPWKQGVFVAATPDIWYMKDTDGDGIADIRNRVYSGFGRDGEQYMLNNLIWGVDHWIYGATAGNGGTVLSLIDPDAEPISVNGRDFRFDPVSGVFETTTETFQFGNTFDDWYNRFVCNQGVPARHAILPDRYMVRSPYLLDVSGVNSLVDGWTRLYKISPIEAWRSIRRARRIAAGRDPTSPGVDHKYLTAGAGLTVYRGDAYPEKYRGNLFIGASTANLVHRRALIPDGPTFRSVRVDKETEFVRSTDNWFRPVNFVNAPDGTLYVLDMSRELIESVHVATKVIKHLDLMHGQDRGRIYRMAPEGFRSRTPHSLSRATTEELVELLKNSNGWHRETAHRLLYERQDRIATDPLRAVVHGSSNSLARMHALWSLKGLDRLTTPDISHGLSDVVPGVRRHAVRLAESQLRSSPVLIDQVLKLAEDDDPQVRLQVALTLGESPDWQNSRAVSGLLMIAKRDFANRWIRTALLSSGVEIADALLVALVEDQTFLSENDGVVLLTQLAQMIGTRNYKPMLHRVLETIAVHPNMVRNPDIQEIVLMSMADGLSRANARLVDVGSQLPNVREIIDRLFEDARRDALSDQIAPSRRIQSIQLLRYDNFQQVEQPLTELIHPRHSELLQISAISALTEHNHPRVALILLKVLESCRPRVRRRILEQLLSREQWTISLLKTITQESMLLREMDPSQRSLLMEHRNNAIRALAEKLFVADRVTQRDEVLASFQQALTLEGNRVRGKEVYQRECVDCHRLGVDEHPVGPNLLAGSHDDPEVLLEHILNPNRNVAPEYMKYTVTDQNGISYTGMIAMETATSIVLQRGEDDRDAILKSNIEEIRNLGYSLMPEGIEHGLDYQEMADLIEFIVSSQYDPGSDPGAVTPVTHR